MFSRSLEFCTPEVAENTLILQRQFYVRFAPWQLIITRTAVSLDVQKAIWLQGRAPLPSVNAVRKLAGLWQIGPKENHNVTWCSPEKSLHVIIPGVREKSQAVDLAAAIDPDGPEGPLKPVIDWNDMGQYRRLASLAILLGFESGMDFLPKPDPGHIQMRRAV